MGFMITQNFPGALGAGGGGLGMAGLTGFGVELDTYDNDTASSTTKPGCGDLNSDHTSIDSLSPPCIDQDGHVRPTALAGGTDLSTMLPPVQLADGNWHTCEVSMTMGSMTVLIDGFVRVTPTALPGFVPGTPYYFGFAGSTGGLFTRQEIRNPSISFPSVQCL
jgi:Bacterial lectin